MMLEMLQTPLFWLVAVPVACAMELWAMLLHGRLWHGVLWWGHESHHRPREGRLERNDIFAVFHASIAIFLIIFGLESHLGAPSTVMTAWGIGMTAFGMSYFVVHDGYIHERLPVGFLDRFAYMRRVRKAHLAHHAPQWDGPPFGLFLGPWELRRVVAARKDAMERAGRGKRRAAA